jgi:hypothetical protein
MLELLTGVAARSTNEKTIIVGYTGTCACWKLDAAPLMSVGSGGIRHFANEALQAELRSVE